MQNLVKVVTPEAPPPPTRELASGWDEYFDPVSGRKFYCHRVSGARSWQPPPASEGVPGRPVSQSSSSDASSSRPLASLRESGSSPTAEIGSMGSESRSGGALHVRRFLLHPWGICQGRGAVDLKAGKLGRWNAYQWKWWDPRRWLVLGLGCSFYGVLFLPFSFALLQETLINGEAVDSFRANRALSLASWIAATVYISSVSLLCMVIFNLPVSGGWYDEGARLSVLMLWVILPILANQALTYRYISLRPELSLLEKGAKKYKLCGRVFSTMNPRNFVNYVYLVYIPGDFFAFAAILFTSSMPWVENGSRPEDEPLVELLSAVLPQFLAGSIDEILVGTLMAFTTIYTLSIGAFIFLQQAPSSVVCELFAGTFYTFTVSRLMSIAYHTDLYARRTVFMLALFAYSSTATFVATLRGELVEREIERNEAVAVAEEKKAARTARNNVMPARSVRVTRVSGWVGERGREARARLTAMPDVRYMPKWIVLERILKGILGMFAVLLEAFPERLVILAMVIILIHLMVIYSWRTCSITFVSRARIGVLSLMLWASLLTLLMLIFPWDGWFLLLVTTISLAFVAFIVFAVYKVFYSDPPDDEPAHLRVRRLNAARDELLKHGVHKVAGGQSAAARPRNSTLSRPAAARPPLALGRETGEEA